MPVIAFANPKGGAGKTTAALLLASVLAARGARIVILDADPERWITQWSSLGEVPAGVEVVSDVTEDGVVDQVESAAARAQFVIIDLEGTASLMVANAVGMADLVVIPSQGGSMDAKGAAKTIKLVRNQERLARRSIPHAVLMTRTSAAVTSRSLRNVLDQLDQAQIPVFRTPIVERAAYRDIFDYGGLLSDLPAGRVSNLDRAVENAEAFAAEVLAKLKEARTGADAGAGGDAGAGTAAETAGAA